MVIIQSEKDSKTCHSTLTCLLNVIDPWFKNSDEGKINLRIFLHLKKAFDTVDHMSKLREYGAEGASHSWLTSYLTNREQFCYFDGSTSSKSSIECGRGLFHVCVPGAHLGSAGRAPRYTFSTLISTRLILMPPRKAVSYVWLYTEA